MSDTYFKRPDTEALKAIKSIVGKTGWKNPEDGARYFEDPRGRFTGRASLIVMPASTDEVAEILSLCNDKRIGIIPFGGGTGVVAGQLSIDSDNAIILSLERMNKIREIFYDDAVMVVEAGCILENVHDAAAKHGMIFPLSMASKGSCCIGGNLATNAGGIQVLRYGNARDLCLGIEAVLPDGTVLHELSPLKKNNTGYDLRHMFIGSEGTLGIITAATLVLKPLDAETETAFLAIDSPAKGLAVYKEMRSHLGDAISALELMSGLGIDLVTSKFPDMKSPFSETPAWALLFEASGPKGLSPRLEAALEACFDKDLFSDAVIAQSQAQRDGLWELREKTPEANRMAGAFCNSDTSVPVSNVNAFIAETIRAIQHIHSDVLINSYGHVGDGNIHHNVFPPEGISKVDFLAANPGIIDSVRLAINDATHAHSGSISAEHGIGRLKTDDLEAYASRARHDTLRRIKAAVDPNNIMNPGALVR